MNHDAVLMELVSALKNVINEFDADIDAITNNKIKIDCRQNLDKAVHWAVFMNKMLDDLNAYLTYFGGKK